MPRGPFQWHSLSKLVNHHSAANFLLSGWPQVSIPRCRQITFAHFSALKSLKFLYAVFFLAATERPETTLGHPGRPRLKDCSNCRKVYVDINTHEMKHIDDQTECFKVRKDGAKLALDVVVSTEMSLGPQYSSGHVSTMAPAT